MTTEASQTTTATPAIAKVAETTTSAPAAKSSRAVAKRAAKTVAAPAPKVTVAVKATKTVKPAKPAKASKASAKPVVAAKVKAPAADKVKVAIKPKAPAKPKVAKPVKEKKPKLVRDSFTIPKAEYTVLNDLKTRANKLASPAKKSELLRAGIKALAAMSDAAFQVALRAVPAIKTGRPAKE